MTDHTAQHRERAISDILEYHVGRFRRTEKERAAHGVRHIGLELKFPVVDRHGDAATPELIDAFWDVCRERGWQPIVDAHSGAITGATGGHADNLDYIRTTTGICVLEFPVAHHLDLFALEGRLKQLRRLAAEFSERTGARMLGLGIQPKSPPGPDLLAKKGRHLFWDDVLPPCNDTPHDDEGSVELFTVIADNQVHVDIAIDEAAAAVNLLNGLAGPILALNANSSIWKGGPDTQHVAVRELFWDWWIGDADRCGMPAKPFANLEDYVRAIADLRPVVTKREGQPLSLCHYDSFADFYGDPQAFGLTAEEQRAPLDPGPEDIDIHDRAFWWNARLSRFATIESRVSCQQPPGELLAPAALVLGLVEALDPAMKCLVGCTWDELQALRVRAAHEGLKARAGSVSVRNLAEPMLAFAEYGLKSRGFGEEAFLCVLRDRLEWQLEPARQAWTSYSRGGVQELIHDYAWA